MMTMRHFKNCTSIHFPTTFTDHYKILQWNVRSIRSRSLDLALVLHFEECSFALLAETWLRSGQSFPLPHFNFICSDRTTGSVVLL